MSIIKTSKKNFGVVPRQAMEEKTMSLKAKGMLAYLLCKPENWQIYVSQLASVLKEGKGAVSSAINELIEHGYILRVRLKDERGKFAGYDYTVFDSPQTEKTVSEKPVSGKPVYGKPATNNKDNSKRDNKKKDNSEPLPFSSPAFLSAWEDWVAHRKEIKHPMTPTASKRLMAKLAKLGEAEAVQAIAHAIEAGWRGLWPKGSPSPAQQRQAGMPLYIYKVNGAEKRTTDKALMERHKAQFGQFFEFIKTVA